MNEDFADLLRALMDAEARFVIVGAHALAVHGIPRATQDLDVLVEPSAGNAERVLTALVRFGAPVEDAGLTREDLTRADMVVQLGRPPRRIDLLTGISGVAFEEAWRTRELHEWGGLRVPFLGRSAMVRNKRATGRWKDLADLEAMGEPALSEEDTV